MSLVMSKSDGVRQTCTQTINIKVTEGGRGGKGWTGNIWEVHLRCIKGFIWIYKADILKKIKEYKQREQHMQSYERTHYACMAEV